jgi:hypothetical protein
MVSRRSTGMPSARPSLALSGRLACDLGRGGPELEDFDSRQEPRLVAERVA